MQSSASARSPSGGRSQPTSSCRIPGSRARTSPLKAVSAGRSGRPGIRRPTTSRTSIRVSTTRRPQAIIDPSTGRLIGGDRYNGIVLPGDGFIGDANQLVVAQDPRVQALFRGEPRGFSDTHYNVFEPRLGASYQLNKQTIVRASTGVFHSRVTLNDSTLLGGNPPFQPMVTVSNGSVDNPGGAGGAADLPFGIQGQDVAFKHPTSYMWSTGVQREVPLGFVLDVTYVGRRGLYLPRERNINQLPAGTTQANPGVNIAALRPYKGYGAIRVSENAGYSRYNSLQISADRRYTNGLKVGVAYTLGSFGGQRERQAQHPVEHLRRHQLLGPVELRSQARGDASTTSTICRSGVKAGR